MSGSTAREQIRCHEWLQIVTHTHSKLASLAFTFSDTSLRRTLQNWQDGQFTTLALLSSITGLQEEGQRELFMVDSDHAAHSADFYHPSNYYPGAAGGTGKHSRAAREALIRRREAFSPRNVG